MPKGQLNHACRVLQERSDAALGSCSGVDLLRELADLDQGLRLRLGVRYQSFVAQGRTAIIMAMVAQGIASPLDAAVHLGAAGALSPVVGTDADAFGILVQAALEILTEMQTGRSK